MEPVIAGAARRSATRLGAGGPGIGALGRRGHQVGRPDRDGEEAADSAVAPAESGTAAEIVGVALAAVILVVTFGSLVAAGMPLLTAVLGVGIAMGAITALTAPLNLYGNSTVLATMLGIAVGTVPAR